LKIKFIYLDTPFWRAEVGRLALFIGGIEFQDVRITRDEFLRSRKTGKLDDGTIIPFRQIPCLNVDGTSINQTAGISRFCGKLSGLYPLKNAINAALIDQIIDMATDINVLLGPSLRERNEENKRSMRKKLACGLLIKKISYLEELLEKENETWFVSKKITIADIAIWRLLGWLTSGMIDYIPTTLIEPFPYLKRNFLNVKTHPKVAEWTKKTYPSDYADGNII
tara:strand:- start:434 stop:1105 length:672 start_codon:yes stop_codon:yes gene_type:complete